MLIDAFSRTAGGIDAAAKVMAQDPPFAVAVFTDADDLRSCSRRCAWACGGTCSSRRRPPDLVDMLVRLRDGRDRDRRRASPPRPRCSPPGTIDLGDWPGAHLGLTRREAELLAAAGRGHEPRATRPSMMGLSSETVRTHTRNLYRKLGVSDRAAAVAVAWREGLVS